MNLRHVDAGVRAEGKLDGLIDLVEQVISALSRMNRGEVKEMATLDDLKAKLAESTTKTDALLTFSQHISDELKTALSSNDPQAIQALIDQLDTENQKEDAFIAANPDPGATSTAATANTATTAADATSSDTGSQLSPSTSEGTDASSTTSTSSDTVTGGSAEVGSDTPTS